MGNGAASEQRGIFRQALDAIAQADAIILGPGSLFESILPNLLIPDVRQAIQRSTARTIYICSLMTEPGMTSGFGVADHIRQIVRYGGFAPDYVLVNAQRIDPDVRQIYAAANLPQASFLAPTPPRTFAPVAIVWIHTVRSSASSG